jgi:hypothetical protein
MKYPIYSAELKINNDLPFLPKYQLIVERANLMKNPNIDRVMAFYYFKDIKEAERKLKYYKKFIQYK